MAAQSSKEPERDNRAKQLQRPFDVKAPAIVELHVFDTVEISYYRHFNAPKAPCFEHKSATMAVVAMIYASKP